MTAALVGALDTALLARARTTLKTAARLDKSPALNVEARQELRELKRAAVLIIGAVIEELVADLDAIEGDCDLEDRTGAEDAFEVHRGSQVDGPGCPIADPGGCEHDGREEDDGR